jgi:hypothetical protein
MVRYLCRINDGDKNDVYDIGVILLEIILGRPIMFHNEVGILKDLVSIIFKFLIFHYTILLNLSKHVPSYNISISINVWQSLWK